MCRPFPFFKGSTETLSVGRLRIDHIFPVSLSTSTPWDQRHRGFGLRNLSPIEKKALKEASWFRQVSFLFFLVNICCGSCLLSVMRLLGSRQIVSITERLTGAISSGISLIHRSICHIPASTSRLLSKENDQHCTRISKSRGVISMRLTCNESTVWEGVCHVDIPNPRFAWLPHDGAKALLLR